MDRSTPVNKAFLAVGRTICAAIVGGTLGVIAGAAINARTGSLSTTATIVASGIMGAYAASAAANCNRNAGIGAVTNILIGGNGFSLFAADYAGSSDWRIIAPMIAAYALGLRSGISVGKLSLG